MGGIAYFIGMTFLFGFLAVAVAMLPVSIYRIVVSIRRREPTGNHAGWLAYSFITLAAYGLVLCPLFMSARKKAENIMCIHNMEALGLGMLQYEQDNDEKFPPRHRWGDAIAPYVKPGEDFQSQKPEDIWRCPASTSTVGYAYNSNLPKSVDELIAPAEIVMLFEADANNRNVVAGSTQLPSRPRHPSLDNFAFADGHARSIPRADTNRVDWVNKPIVVGLP